MGHFEFALDGASFTECANHLSAIVSELPDYQLTRKVSATDSTKVKAKRIRGGGGNASSLAAKRKGIYVPDGSVWTGYYSDWEKMSDADKQTVMDTRKKNKAKGSTPMKGSNSNKRNVSGVKAQLAELKKTIAAIQLTKSSKDDDTSATDESSVPDNAGDSFGGRNKKKVRKD